MTEQPETELTWQRRSLVKVSNFLSNVQCKKSAKEKRFSLMYKKRSSSSAEAPKIVTQCFWVNDTEHMINYQKRGKQGTYRM